jgi:cation diffusion facilitator family transporter
MAGSKSVVIAALIANGAIAVLKFGGFLLTGSPSMLSETYHSVSDTGNQVFLLIGLRYAGRDSDRRHPFGYGKAQFFYAFVVSMLLFGIAGWESTKHGYHALTHPEAVHTTYQTFAGFRFPTHWVNYTVLLGAIGFESYALKKAWAEFSRQMREHEWDGIVDGFRKTADVTTLTALTEDAIALIGAALALVGVFLSQFTGDPIFDALTSFLIGLILMGFAIALAWENKRLLLGESLPQADENELRRLVIETEDVEHVDELRSVYFGPNNVIVTADISFAPELSTEEIDERVTAIETSLTEFDASVSKVYIEPEI